MSGNQDIRGFNYIQQQLFASLCADDREKDATAIFILGAPRAGSTILYQAVSAGFCLPYFANFTNDFFPETPILGLAMQAGLADRVELVGVSQFGKVPGPFQPSEASAVMRNWFGGGHPSQLVSATILPGKARHLTDTLAAAFALFGRPLVIKNAWNCFRVEAIAELLPEAFFVWIRRDIGDAAKSDLNARYVTKGSPQEWNSATPANVEELRKRPYWEQVVENQAAFNCSIGEALRRVAADRFVEIWHEDFCADPVRELKRIAEACALLDTAFIEVDRIPRVLSSRPGWDLGTEDIAAIDAFIDRNSERLSQMARSFSSERTHTRAG